MPKIKLQNPFTSTLQAASISVLEKPHVPDDKNALARRKQENIVPDHHNTLSLNKISYITPRQKG